MTRLLPALLLLSACTTGRLFLRPGVAPSMTCADWDEPLEVPPDQVAAWDDVLDEIVVASSAWRPIGDEPALVDRVAPGLVLHVLDGEVRTVHRDVPEGMRVGVANPSGGRCLSGDLLVFEGTVEVVATIDGVERPLEVPATLQAPVEDPGRIAASVSTGWIAIDEVPAGWDDLVHDGAPTRWGPLDEVQLWFAMDGQRGADGRITLDGAYRNPDVNMASALLESTWDASSWP